MTLSSLSGGLGVLLVLAAAAAVLLPAVEAAVAALLLAVLLAAAYEATSGAALLAAVQLLAGGGPVAALAVAARRGRHPLLDRRRSGRPRGSGVAAAALLGLGLLATLAATSPHWARGVATGSVAGALRHSGLLGLAAAVAALLVCLAGGLAVGRVDPEEERHVRSREERQRREERARRRRDDRVAARAARPGR